MKIRQVAEKMNFRLLRFEGRWRGVRNSSDPATFSPNMISGIFTHPILVFLFVVVSSLSPDRSRLLAAEATSGDKKPQSKTNVSVPTPMPSASELDAALALVRSVHMAEYRARSVKDRIALAEALQKEADEPSNNPAWRYVLLREARDLASASGDFRLALAAADEMILSYQVDPFEVKESLLVAAASRKLTDAVAAEAVIDAFEELSSLALGAADLEHALKLATQADGVAKKGKIVSRMAQSANARKEIHDLTAEYAGLKAAIEKLKTDPENGATNTTVGKFYCFAAGAWDIGLPLLFKSDNQTLRDLAGADVNGLPSPEAAVALGDRWWNLSEKNAGIARKQLQSRAVYWYQKGGSELTAETRSRVDTRTASLNAGKAGINAGDDRLTDALGRLISQLPANLRPKRGQPWDDAAVDQLLTGKLLGATLEGDLQIREVERRRVYGRDNILVRFESIGPILEGGLQFRMDAEMEVRQVTPAITAALVAGTVVSVQSKMERVWSFLESKSNGDPEAVCLRLALANPRFTVKQRAGEGPRNKAVAVLDTVARGIPATAYPKAGLDWDSGPARNWLSGNFRQVEIEDRFTIEAMELSTTQTNAGQLHIYFNQTAPQKVGGQEFVLALDVWARTPAEIESLSKLAVHDSVSVRGVIPRLWVTVDGKTNTSPGRVRFYGAIEKQGDVEWVVRVPKK